MITVCSGYRDKHGGVIRCGIMLKDDGQADPEPWKEVSDGMCEECSRSFIQVIHQLQEEGRI